MELSVLGAGPAYTDREGAVGAAYLVTAGPDAVLLDLGQGAFPALARAVEPGRLLAVLISHLHPDHFIDLVALRHYLRYGVEPPGRVRVLGPAGLGARLDALHDEQGFSAAALDLESLGVGSREIGTFTIESALVEHTVESYAFRVTPGPADEPGLVYSGDCGRADDLLALVRPGDTLLAEVSFGPGPVPPGVLHLDGPAVGRLAARAAVGRVLLTHLQMGFEPDATVEAVGRQFRGDVRFVWPGERVSV